MTFFLPAAKDSDEAESVYKSIVAFAVEQTGKSISSRHIQEVTFTREGKTITETVGEPSTLNKEVVIALLDADDMYLACTATRGVAQGQPMLIGKWQTNRVVPFDAPTQ